MRIFATFVKDGDGFPQIYRIGLNPKAFELNKRHTSVGYHDECESSSIYWQEINNEETELTSPDEYSWKPYYGKIEADHGWIINNKFYSEEDDECPEGLKDDDNLDDYGPRVVKYEVYKEGNLTSTQYIEEYW